jgi:hypothetical protein
MALSGARSIGQLIAQTIAAVARLAAPTAPVAAQPEHPSRDVTASMPCAARSRRVRAERRRTLQTTTTRSSAWLAAPQAADRQLVQRVVDRGGRLPRVELVVLADVEQHPSAPDPRGSRRRGGGGLHGQARAPVNVRTRHAPGHAPGHAPAGTATRASARYGVLR